MKIKAKANGNVIEADDEAARQLIEAGIYEAADASEPLSAELPPEEVHAKSIARQTKRRKTE
jgi:hypothetical protein